MTIPTLDHTEHTGHETFAYVDSPNGCEHGQLDCEHFDCPILTRTRIVNSDLADRVRSRLNTAPDADVFIIEENGVYGYSEYTIEGSWWSFTVECDGMSYAFGTSYSDSDGPAPSDNGLAQLLAWLDQPAPQD